MQYVLHHVGVAAGRDILEKTATDDLNAITFTSEVRAGTRNYGGKIEEDSARLWSALQHGSQEDAVSTTTGKTWMEW